MGHNRRTRSCVDTRLLETQNWAKSLIDVVCALIEECERSLPYLLLSNNPTIPNRVPLAASHRQIAKFPYTNVLVSVVRT